MKSILIIGAGLATAGAALGFAKLADRPVEVPVTAAPQTVAVERVTPVAAEPAAPQVMRQPAATPAPAPVAADVRPPVRQAPVAHQADLPELLAAFPRGQMDDRDSLGLLPFQPVPGPLASQDRQDGTPTYSFKNLPMIGVYR